jgi:two-component system, NtrC family, response regulator GlrR
MDDRLVGRSTAMRRLRELIDRVAPTDTTVLVTGETGTGKELVAESIHAGSARAGGPFIVLDCGALPAQLVEDELFGHELGAFTGATAPRIGLFEAARGGTLFLDEVGELPPEVQPKLLRAVETRTIRRIGGIAPIPCDVRLIAATHRDLAAELGRGFRADLYFRLAVARVHVPPLRERVDDLALLIARFAGDRAVPDTFHAWAARHPWPGNVRELRAAVERAVTLCRPPTAQPGPTPVEIDLSLPFREVKRRVVDDLERRYITALLDAHGGNVSAAARAAELDRMTIYNMLQRAGLRD